jgi:hypothetical protein
MSRKNTSAKARNGGIDLACVVNIGARHCLGAPHADVEGGIGTVAARAVSAKKVVPAVTADRVGGFAVDGDINGLITGDAFSCFRVEFDKADVTEEGPLGGAHVALAISHVVMLPSPSLHWVGAPIVGFRSSSWG